MAQKNCPGNSKHAFASSTSTIITCYLLAITTTTIIINIGSAHISLPSAYAQSPGETGTVAIKYLDTNYTITTNFSNGKVVNATLLSDDNQLLLDLEPNGTGDGRLVVTLPRALIDSKSTDLSSDVPFTIVFSDSEATYEEGNSTEAARTLLIDIPEGTEYLTIVGTQVVPEFPSGVVFAISAIIGVTVLSTRLLRTTFLSYNHLR